MLLRVITRAHAELEWATVAAAREVSDPGDAEELVTVVTKAWFEFIDSHRAAFALMRQERYLALGQVERIRVDQSRVLAEPCAGPASSPTSMTNDSRSSATRSSASPSGTRSGDWTVPTSRPTGRPRTSPG